MNPNSTKNELPFSPRTGILLVILATAFWSTSGIFITLVVDGGGISPVSLAFWRDFGTFSCLFIGIGLVRPRLLRVRRKDLPWLIAMGVISIGSFHVAWNMAVLMNGPGVATVIQSNAPIIVTLLAWLIWKEPLTGRKIAAVALSFAGTILIARLDLLGSAKITPLGVLLGVYSAIAYSGLSLFGKKLSQDYNPWTIMLYIFAVGTLILLPFQLRVGTPWPLPPHVVAYFIALVVFTTVLGFGIYTTALRSLQASIASITATAEVPFAAILAYIFLGERLDGWQLVGAAMVITGVVLVSLPRRKRLVEVQGGTLLHSQPGEEAG
jgi:drug/metabolite transporter (DMT)-like permease